MFCSKCGAEINDEAVVCVKCGCSVVPAYKTSAEIDNPDGSFGIGFILGFFGGLIGLILALCVESLQRPKTKSGAITGFCITAGISIISTIVYVIIIGCVLGEIYWFI